MFFFSQKHCLLETDLNLRAAVCKGSISSLSPLEPRCQDHNFNYAFGPISHLKSNTQVLAGPCRDAV